MAFLLHSLISLSDSRAFSAKLCAHSFPLSKTCDDFGDVILAVKERAEVSQVDLGADSQARVDLGDAVTYEKPSGAHLEKRFSNCPLPGC